LPQQIKRYVFDVSFALGRQHSLLSHLIDDRSSNVVFDIFGKSGRPLVPMFVDPTIRAYDADLIALWIIDVQLERRRILIVKTI
jgi:hypothetical protein